MTITTKGSILGDQISLTAVGAVTVSSAETIELRSGLVTSRSAATTLSADTDHDGVGDLVIASGFNVLVQAYSTATLSGDQITIGSVTGYGHVITLTGDIFVRSNFNFDNRGAFFVVNTSSRIRAGGSLFVGEVGFTTGTPYAISITSASVSAARDVVFYSQSDVTLTGALFTVTGNTNIYANQSIAIIDGQLVTSGSILALTADVDRDNTGDVSLAGTALLKNPSAVNIAGYSVTRAAGVTSRPLRSLSLRSIKPYSPAQDEPTSQPKHGEDRRAKRVNKRLGQLLDYEPSARGKIIYIKLNTPRPCPPRSACPWSTGRAPVASFINDAPDLN